MKDNAVLEILARTSGGDPFASNRTDINMINIFSAVKSPPKEWQLLRHKIDAKKYELSSRSGWQKWCH